MVAIIVTLAIAVADRRRAVAQRLAAIERDNDRRADDRERDDRLRREATDERERRETAERRAREDYEARQVIVGLTSHRHRADSYAAADGPRPP